MSWTNPQPTPASHHPTPLVRLCFNPALAPPKSVHPPHTSPLHPTCQIMFQPPRPSQQRSPTSHYPTPPHLSGYVSSLWTFTPRLGSICHVVTSIHLFIHNHQLTTRPCTRRRNNIRSPVPKPRALLTGGPQLPLDNSSTPTLNSDANEDPLSVKFNIGFTENNDGFSEEKKTRNEMEILRSVTCSRPRPMTGQFPPPRLTRGSLGPGHLLYHDPGHWVPAGVGVALGYPTARAYPEFHVDRATWQVLTVALKRTVVVEVRAPGWPGVEDDRF